MGIEVEPIFVLFLQIYLEILIQLKIKKKEIKPHYLKTIFLYFLSLFNDHSYISQCIECHTNGQFPILMVSIGLLPYHILVYYIYHIYILCTPLNKIIYNVQGYSHHILK